MKTQRKIVKAGADPSRYFTFGMLNRGCIIRRGIAGLDADQPEAPQLRKLMESHPSREKRVLSEEHKQALMQGFQGGLAAV